MSQSGTEPQKSFSADQVPESAGSSREMRTGSAEQPVGAPLPTLMTGAELRLLAWTEMPERHRNEVCRQIRMRCETFISTRRIDRHERRSEIDRLVSEVVAHLLGATTSRWQDEDDATGVAEEIQKVPMPWLIKGRLDPWEPVRDARVIWLVEETGSRRALIHRYEDTRRRDRGGKWDGSSYPLVAVDDQTMEQLSGHYDPGADDNDALQAEDTLLAWHGLVLLITHQFGADDDVVALIQVLSNDKDAQHSFGTQWPIGKIVKALNDSQPGDVWDEDRVDNAKRRLTKFILRMKQKNGLDAVDLRALLVRYAREHRSRTKLVNNANRATSGSRG